MLVRWITEIDLAKRECHVGQYSSGVFCLTESNTDSFSVWAAQYVSIPAYISSSIINEQYDS